MSASARAKQIYGIGVDIVSISRIKRLHERYGDRFLKKAYHQEEIEIFQNCKQHNVNKYDYLASRWAAKEAVQKAISSPRILFPEIFVTSSDDPTNRRPCLKFEGLLARICAERNICSSHVSISQKAAENTQSGVLQPPRTERKETPCVDRDQTASEGSPRC